MKLINEKDELFFKKIENDIAIYGIASVYADIFKKGYETAQQQLHPFIVELLDWTSQNYTSSDGIHCKIGNTGIDNWITSEQLLEEFINSKTK